MGYLTGSEVWRRERWSEIEERGGKEEWGEGGGMRVGKGKREREKGDKGGYFSYTFFIQNLGVFTYQESVNLILVFVRRKKAHIKVNKFYKIKKFSHFLILILPTLKIYKISYGI